MASSGTPPSARGEPFIASAGELVYLWGGKGDNEPETQSSHTAMIQKHGREKSPKDHTHPLD